VPGRAGAAPHRPEPSPPARSPRRAPVGVRLATVLAVVLATGCAAPTGGAPIAAVRGSAAAGTGSPVDGQRAGGMRAGGTRTAPAVGRTYVATARGSHVTVLGAPGAAAGRRLANPTPTGAPLTLMVLQVRDGWVRVQVPQRPNGSTGWVAIGEVTLSTTSYALVVHRRSHRLQVWRDGSLTATYPVGVGRSVSPTPAGTYFLTELLRQPSPRGPYGPFAFGLSAYSDTVTRYAGGPGQIGLHGTDAPTLVGTDVSHGCLRVTNDVITVLAGQLPLGTPVRITG